MTKALDTSHLWMPFTANRQYKAKPRLMASASGMYYATDDGRKILDATAGLWCVNAGHCHPRIVEAVQKQVAIMDFAPTFQMGHAKAFEAATALAEMAPEGLNRIFFCNDGSEGVDTALKIALAYHRMRGDAGRTRLIGRERAYHGVGFGGIAVGGIAGNRKQFGPGLAADHLRHPLNIEKNAYSRGLPLHGAEIADELEQRLLALHDPSTVAAVIVEPLQGSTGVILPPKGYLEKIRAICDKHGILLIFDEVITGFGRLGTAFGADFFKVKPDMMVCAKGLTNATVPMGAVIVKQEIHDAFMDAAPADTIEFFHGYTYSGHPVAAAAAIATLEVYKEEQLFERAAEMSSYFEEAAHSLKGLPFVKDIRNLGLVCGIELEGITGKPGARAYDLFNKAFWYKGLLLRTTADVIALSPPLIINKAQVDEIFGSIADLLKAIK
ncbi:aspartate aminotransferase family protein [Herminiimonas fonticola]|uniref:Beta-alanine--pyruvate transaminase n=1 Tax=Herminiimonas fonticola TaxID=303380 RepID=A0A4R6GI98_9BURK|nr:aspartate aminotransferase family protein [Herminiimonas fonticola]RBA25454.1 Adenosylmethionine-8-amino-7-oxononanoate aminotransferase [Herminiimonas fonticola]TDN94567.1 beta-alanine--pyruvate transaminase [Herminiimonas fonticola]